MLFTHTHTHTHTHNSSITHASTPSPSQILYANEGESKRDLYSTHEPLGMVERSMCLSHKGHELVPTLYHFPSSCEACTRPLWNVFKPPPALECRRCHLKCHKDHLDRKEEVLAPCKGQEGVRGWGRSLCSEGLTPSLSLSLCRSLSLSLSLSVHHSPIFFS